MSRINPLTSEELALAKELRRIREKLHISAARMAVQAHMSRDQYKSYELGIVPLNTKALKQIDFAVSNIRRDQEEAVSAFSAILKSPAVKKSPGGAS